MKEQLLPASNFITSLVPGRERPNLLGIRQLLRRAVLESDERRKATHPPVRELRGMLAALPIPDAGLVLHLLDCARCAALARKVLEPKPVRRRRPRGGTTT
jgi:hypothetical protein